MHRARLIRVRRLNGLRLGLSLLLALLVSASCGNLKDTESVVPSERGAIAPDAGGVLLSEAAACQKLKSAEASARQGLGCDALTRSCPDSIRPAGGADCFRYDQGSIDGCGALFRSFKTCQEFAQHPCLISAVSECDTGEAGAGGAFAETSGAAGAGGAPTSGEAFSSGAGGETAAGAGGA